MEAIKRNGKAYLICLAAFTALLVLAYCIPVSAVDRQVSESADQLVSEGDWPTILSPYDSTKMDNFTTAIMLSIADHADQGNVLRNAMAPSYYTPAGGADSQVAALKAGLGQSAVTGYQRYWHGYLAFLKPLLVFLNIAQIRLLTLGLLLALIVITCCEMARKTRIAFAVAFALSLAMVNVFMAGASLPFFSVFFLGILGVLMVVRSADEMSDFGCERHWDTFFFVVGAVCVYLDFLSAPLVTLGLPLVAYFIMRRGSLDSLSWRRILLFLVTCCVWWAVGYAVLWFSKWVLATLVLGQNVIAEGIANVMFRSGDSAAETAADTVSRAAVILRNLKVMAPWWVVKGALAALALILVAFLRHPMRGSRRLAVPLLIIAAMPYVWFAVVANHSYEHFWFTYRIQVVSVFAIASVILAAVDWRAVQADLGRARARLRGR